MMNGKHADMHEKMVVTEIPKTDDLSGINIINLEKRQFEYGHPVFWNWFEATFGKWLAQHIENKSIPIILEHATEEEKEQWARRENRKKILARYRVNFGKNVIRELYTLRTSFFNTHSKLMQHVCKYVANAECLDDVYNALGSFSWDGVKIWPDAAMPDVFSRFYLSCPNAQATRNRYIQVVKLYEQLESMSTLSIACGSAQPVLDAMRRMTAKGICSDSKLILTDINKDSLDCAMKKAKLANVEKRVECVRVPYTKLSTVLAGTKVDVVEACGIMDYLNDHESVELLKVALGFLNEGGTILVSNMSKTRGAELLRQTYNWEITYREPERFGRLIKIAGGKNIKVYVEPWEIHPVATATL